MKARLFTKILTVLFCALLMMSFLSCRLDTSIAGGGIGGTGVINQGEISAFGSIIVNGTEFDTSKAKIIIEGQEIGFGDDVVMDNLDLGMYVTVVGTSYGDDARAVADQVIYSDNIRGPVQSIRDINITTKDIVVLGQHVIVNALTKLKGTTFAAINQNDFVEVSGMPDDMGIIWATYIHKTGQFIPGMMVELNGYVVDLDTVFKTFRINDLLVDYSLADTSGLPGGAVSEGILVEIEGALDTVDGEMFAAKVELADELDILDADQIEVMGFVNDVFSGVTFVVGNQLVQIDEDTEFIDGSQYNIVLGAKLEAEGSLDNGVIHAWEIEFWEPDQIEMEGIITDIVSVFEFTLGEQLVYTNDQTLFEDGTPEDIAVGTIIEIKGRLVEGILIADKVSFEDE